MDNIKFKQLAAILIAAGLILLGFTLRAEYAAGRLASNTVTVGAKVIDRFTTADKRGSDPTARLRVRFETSKGESVTVEREVEETYWAEHPRGSELEVSYSEQAPMKATLVGASSEATWTWARILGGALLVLSGIGVLLFDRWRT